MSASPARSKSMYMSRRSATPPRQPSPRANSPRSSNDVDKPPASSAADARVSTATNRRQERVSSATIRRQEAISAAIKQEVDRISEQHAAVLQQKEEESQQMRHELQIEIQQCRTDAEIEMQKLREQLNVKELDNAQLSLRVVECEHQVTVFEGKFNSTRRQNTEYELKVKDMQAKLDAQSKSNTSMKSKESTFKRRVNELEKARAEDESRYKKHLELATRRSERDVDNQIHKEVHKVTETYRKKMQQVVLEMEQKVAEAQDPLKEKIKLLDARLKKSEPAGG